MRSKQFYMVLAILMLVLGSGCKRSPSVAEVMDSDTAVSGNTLPGVGPDAESPMVRAAIGNEVFDQSRMLVYRVTMDPALLSDMEAHGDDEEYRVASVVIEGLGNLVQYDQVGFRYKGAWSLHHCWDDYGGVRSYAEECARISTKIKFNEYDDGARLDGLKKVNLHALSGDESKLRDTLGYRLFRDFGVDAPRTAFAQLYINNEGPFLVLAVEQIDGRYTAHHYPDGGDGNLYKEIWPRPGLSEAVVAEHLKTNNGPTEPTDVSDFLAFGDAVGDATDETLDETLGAQVDIEHLLHYLVVDRALRNWDGITAFYSEESSHNFYWYRDNSVTPMFHLIPWDLDQVLWTFDPYMHPEQWVTAQPVPDWNVLPMSCDPQPVWSPDNDVSVVPPGCDHLIGLLARNRFYRFAELGTQFLADIFVPDVLFEEIDRWVAVLQSAVDADPGLDAVGWQKGVSTLKSAISSAADQFAAHLQEGYIVEQPLVEPDNLNLVTPNSGLQPLGLTNFEFAPPPADHAIASSQTYVSTASTTDVVWSSDSPLSGTGDLLMTTDFVKQPGLWNEYAGVILYTSNQQAMDISGFTQLSVTLWADATRTVRVDFRSPVYDTLYGGAPPLFSKELQLSAGPQVVKIRLDSLSYPDWAKGEWSGQMGWTGSDFLPRAEVLKAVNGLLFETYPQRTSNGEMVLDTETVTIRVDNIYFQ